MNVVGADTVTGEPMEAPVVNRLTLELNGKNDSRCSEC